MEPSYIRFKDWIFKVDKELTHQTYSGIIISGSENCNCDDCKNYIAYRDRVFPKEVIDLFMQLGINYKKEVEVTKWEELPNGLHHIGGWFHFKGQILSGKDYRVPVPQGGHTFYLTKITDNFSIGFGVGNDMTFFQEETGLVQVEFDTYIPWVIEKSFETF